MAVKQTAGRDALGEFAPKFAELNDDVLFGQVWSREDKLSLRDRSIVTVVALMAQGLTDSSFQYHLTTAKNNGVTKTEIAEILTHAAFYAGWPKAWAAFRMAKEVWAEDNTADAKAKHQNEMVFPIGAPNDAFAKYFIGQSYLASLSTQQVGIYNVTFEPGCRNNWHIHHAKSGGGQILVCVAGHGAVSTLNLTTREPQTEGVKKPAAAGYPQPTAPASEGRVLLREVGREKPATIKRMLSDIYRQNRTDVKGIRTKKYGIGVEVLGIYVSNDVIYIHTCMYNDTNISFEVDARQFIVADKKLAKRTAQQQTPLEILRVCNDPAVVRGHQRQRTVFALPKLTISDDKVLLLEIVEKNGARHQTVEIPAGELLDAKLL